MKSSRKPSFANLVRNVAERNARALLGKAQLASRLSEVASNLSSRNAAGRLARRSLSAILRIALSSGMPSWAGGVLKAAPVGDKLVRSASL